MRAAIALAGIGAAATAVVTHAVGSAAEEAHLTAAVALDREVPRAEADVLDPADLRAAEVVPVVAVAREAVAPEAVARHLAEAPRPVVAVHREEASHERFPVQVPA